MFMNSTYRYNIYQANLRKIVAEKNLSVNSKKTSQNYEYKIDSMADTLPVQSVTKNGIVQT